MASVSTFKHYVLTDGNLIVRFSVNDCEPPSTYEKFLAIAQEQLAREVAERDVKEGK